MVTEIPNTVRVILQVTGSPPPAVPDRGEATVGYGELGSRSARSQVMELDKLGNFVMIVYIYLCMYTVKYEVTVNDEDSANFQGTNPGIKSPKRGRRCIFQKSRHKLCLSSRPVWHSPDSLSLRLAHLLVAVG